MRFVMCAVVLLSLLSNSARAEEKKGKDKPKDSGQFDDLFGTPTNNGGNLDAMKKATEGMNTKKSGDAMAPKVGAVGADEGVKFLGVFAAEKIVEDKKLGCQPAGRDKKRLTAWTFDEVPAKAHVRYSVCLTMQSNSGREMSIDLKVVDGRGQRVNSYKDVVNFRGRTEKVDHVIEFEPPIFKLAGQYHYVIDIDGKEAARLPLFVVKVEGETSGAVGSAPSDLPPKQEATPPQAEDPLKAATSRDP
jgi:hypothetical protein